jgi:ABC-type antimicrobial peptide transport system permease subunit
MSWRDLIVTAWSNLWRHLVRTILSAIGVMVGILTIVTMLALGVGMQREVNRTFRDAGLETVRVYPVTEERSAFDLLAEPRRTIRISQDLVDELAAREDVSAVRPLVYPPYNSSTYLGIGEQMVRVRAGISPWGPSDPFTLPPTLVAGEELADDARGLAAVSTDVLEKLGYGGEGAGGESTEDSSFEHLLGQEATLVLKAPRGETQTFTFRVTGVIENVPGGGYPGVYVGTPDALAIKAWWYNDSDILENDGYDGLIVKAASLTTATDIVAELEGRGFRIQSLKAALEMINKVMIVIKTMLGSVGGLALLVASLGIANTMVMAVYERTREIGVLKAIGASPGDIRALFVTEAALIGLLGGIVGTVGGWLLGLGLNEGILAVLRWQKVPVEGTFFVVTPWLVVLALAFATVVGLLAGLYPAARAARLAPLEALRYE